MLRYGKRHPEGEDRLSSIILTIDVSATIALDFSSAGVDARRTNDHEPSQHVARSRTQRDHGKTAHDACFRTRPPCGLALEAERPMVLRGNTLRYVADELEQPVVEFTEVPENECTYRAVLVDEVAFTPPHCVYNAGVST